MNKWLDSCCRSFQGALRGGKICMMGESQVQERQKMVNNTGEDRVAKEVKRISGFPVITTVCLPLPSATWNISSHVFFFFLLGCFYHPTETLVHVLFGSVAIEWHNFKMLPSKTTHSQQQPAAALEGLGLSALLKGVGMLIVKEIEGQKVNDISLAQIRQIWTNNLQSTLLQAKWKTRKYINQIIPAEIVKKKKSCTCNPQSSFPIFI